MTQDILLDIERWRSSKAAEKRRAVEALCAALPIVDGKAPFAFSQLLETSDALGVVMHTATNQPFIVVPGGTLLMGFSLDDLFSFARVIDPSEVLPEQCLDQIAPSRPLHPVAIRPFLVGATLFDSSVFEGASHEESLDAAKRQGFALMSEAEWEWCAREGGAVRFVNVPPKEQVFKEDDGPSTILDESGWGLREMTHESQALADDWHDNYVGAPPTAEAWLNATPTKKVVRHPNGMWQSSGESISLQAAYRLAPPDEGEYRLVYPIASAPVAVSTTEHGIAATVEALVGTDKKAKAALLALEMFVQLTDDGSDVIPLVDACLGPAMLSSVRAQKVLTALARRIGDPFYFSRPEEGEDWQTPCLLRHAPALISLLGHEEVKMKNAALALLSGVRTPSEPLVTAVQALLESEKKVEVLCSALLVLGVWARNDPTLTASIEGFLSDKRKLVKGAAACAITATKGLEHIGSSATKTLVATMAAGGKLSGGFAFFGGSLSQGALLWLKDGSVALREQVALQVMKTLASQAVPEATTILLLASLLFVEAKEPVKVLDAASLSELQKQAVIAMSQKQNMYDSEYLNGPGSDRFLAGYGIPDSMLTRRIWIGLDAPGAADEELAITWEGKVCDWPIWRHAEHLHLTSREGSEEYALFAEKLRALPLLTQLALALEPRPVFRVGPHHSEGMRSWELGYANLMGLSREDIYEAAAKENQAEFSRLFTEALTRQQHLRSLSITAESFVGEDFFWDLAANLPAGQAFTVEQKDAYWQALEKDKASTSEDVLKRLDETEALERFRQLAGRWLEQELAEDESLRAHGRGETIAEVGVVFRDLDLMKLAMRLDARRAWGSVVDLIEEAATNWPELARLEEDFAAKRKKTKDYKVLMRTFS